MSQKKIVDTLKDMHRESETLKWPFLSYLIEMALEEAASAPTGPRDHKRPPHAG